MSHLLPSLSTIRDPETEYQSTRSRLSRREKLRLSVLSEPQKVEVCRPWEPMRSAADILLYGSGSCKSQEPYIVQLHCYIASCIGSLLSCTAQLDHCFPPLSTPILFHRDALRNQDLERRQEDPRGELPSVAARSTDRRSPTHPTPQRDMD
jgi:hypothetical protein